MSPLAVMGQWRDCILPHIATCEHRLYICESRTTCRATENGTKIPITAISRNSIVLASYGQIMVPKTGDAMPFPGITWDRIILDEAHTIKNSKTQTFESVGLLGTHKNTAKWAVTGTPLQNRLDDIYALFQFVGVPTKILRHRNI